jgi:tetratricopeptide (TPR) repeat protein
VGPLSLVGEEISHRLRIMQKLGTISGLSQSRFIGRELEFEDLKEHLESCIQGEGRLVFVVGEAGIGKTRLISELSEYAKSKDVLSLSGRCLYHENAEPYLPFIDAFGEFIIGRKGTGDDSISTPTSEEFYAMGLVGIFGSSSSTDVFNSSSDDDDIVSMGLLPIQEDDDEEGSRVIRKINPQQERAKLFESLSQLVIEVSSERPLLLVLDDLQWADDGSLQLLHYLARNIQSSRVMICGAYRPEELKNIHGDGHPLAKTLRRMSPEKLYHEITLDRFDDKQSTSMIESILKKKDIPESFTKKLYEESEGNPFFIEEVAKSLVNEGLINVQNYTWETKFDPSKIHIPGTIKDVIGRRIDRLDSETKAILRYASAIGNRFSFTILHRISGVDEEALIDSIDALIAFNMIHEDLESKEEVYRFDHTQIREVIYNSMSRSRRRLMHKKIGYILEDLNKDRLDDVVYNLAHHFNMGRDIPKTLLYTTMAGEKAVNSFAPEDALSYYHLATEALDGMEQTQENKQKMVTLLMRLGEISFNLSKWNAALDHYNRAIGLCEQIDDEEDKGESLRKIGYVLNRMGDWDMAAYNFERSLVISKNLENPIGIADSHRGLGYIHWRLGEYEDAISHYNECIQVSMSVGDMHTIALAFIELGNVYIETGEIDMGIDYYQKSLKELEPMGDFGEMARALNNLGDSYLKKGDYDKAIEYFKKCEEVGKRIGRKDVVGWSLFNAGEAYALKGDSENALEHAQKSLDILTSVGDKLGLQACYKIFGMAYGLKEEWELSEKNFKTCIMLGEETNVPYLQAEVHYYYGKMLKNKGDRDLAKEQFNHALEILKNLDTEEFLNRVKSELEDL